MTELYIVRHGETDTNFEMRINGRSTDLPLNETGIKQAQDLAQGFNIEDFDAIYTSPMKRAKQTAEILNQGYFDTINEDERLYEADYGSWDGVKEEDIYRDYPQTLDENGFILPNYIEYAKDAEDYEDVYRRVESFLQDMEKLDGKKVLVVCHGFVSRAFLKQVMNISDISKIIQPDNAGVSKYQLTNQNRYLRYYARKRFSE